MTHQKEKDMSNLVVKTLATEVIRNSEHSDPTLLAKELMEAIPDENTYEAMEQMARHYMQYAIGVERYRIHKKMPSIGNSKASAVRERWNEILTIREYLPGSDEWIQLGNATQPQLLAMAELRHQKAAANIARAEAYEMLASALLEHDVTTVADLPTDALEAAFT